MICSHQGVETIPLIVAVRIKKGKKGERGFQKPFQEDNLLWAFMASASLLSRAISSSSFFMSKRSSS
jgi:hypothetical protein